MDKKHEFPVSYCGRALDYAAARILCSIAAREVQVDLSNPDREKGIVRRRILECAKSIVATFGFPQAIMSRFLIQSMQGVSARTIFDALPAKMKDSKKAANARGREMTRLQGDFDVPFTRRLDDDSAIYEVVLNRDQIPMVLKSIKKWERSKSDTLGLWLSEQDELFRISIPSHSELEV